MEGEIVNRVAKSPLVTIDLEELYESGDRMLYDLKNNLYQETILRERDFREFLKEHDWSQYAGRHIAINCSADAIIPTWAYMLLTIKLEPYAKSIIYGDLDQLNDFLWNKSLKKIVAADYTDKKVVIKGCSKIKVPTSIYVEVTRLIRPYAASIMYGEPCSTVPLYKAPRK